MSVSNRTCVLKTCSCVTFKLSFQGDIASKVQPAQLTICMGDIRDTTGIQLLLRPPWRQG